MRARFVFWLGCIGIAAASALAYSLSTPDFDSPAWERVALFVILGFSGFASTVLLPDGAGRRFSISMIWLPAIALRILLLPTAPSDDVNRYLWEGKLVRSGISPYTQTADAAELAVYRDDYWSGINHKDKPTAYPPLAELAFALTGSVAYHPMAFKLLFVLADLLTLGAILRLLSLRGLSPAFSGFYALNPVVLLAYAGEAHFDALMIAPLVWALSVRANGRPRLSVALAALSGGLKWITLPLIPFFAGRKYLSGALLAATVLLVPALFFRESLIPLLGGLFEFGGTRNFNGPVYDLLLFGFDLPRHWASIAVAAVFLCVLLWRWTLRDDFPPDSHIRWVLGTLLVCAPTVHFWYIAWIIPFVCLRPSLPWILLSISSGAYFTVWIHLADGRGWRLLPWQQVLFWAPFFAALLYDLWSTRGRCILPRRRSGNERSPSFAVVIPVLNAAGDLPGALASVSAQETAAGEVIVVDAGPNDEIEEIARTSRLPVRVLRSEPGRGGQVAAGIEASRSDWVVVLHVDARLAPGSLGTLQRAVAAHPGMIGGAFGQRFTGAHPELVLIEILNDCRALFFRTAFGDQTQFFHRETALELQLMPKQPLMEDVESSWRVRERGAFVFLGRPCAVSHRKWERRNWVKRFCLVIRLVSRYRWARMRGAEPAARLSHKLYHEYYAARK